MREVVLPVVNTVAAWRREARALAAAGVPPEAVLWSVGQGTRDLFADGAGGPDGTGALPRTPEYFRQEEGGGGIRVSKTALDTIESALCHSDPERFARGYRLVLRLSRGAVAWGDRSDADMLTVLRHAKAVGRDIHKMHAFVRFREVPTEGARRAFAAWFEPEHPCVERGTPFFARRFGDMDWVIATPGVTARFEAGRLRFEETRAEMRPPEDATEELWRTYYASIFNPARVMVKAMCAEMPKKYWKNLPEAELIPDLVRGAEARVRGMAETAPAETAAPRVDKVRARTAALLAEAAPEDALGHLRRDLSACARCGICARATAPVPGEGPAGAPLMIVGEQPGDHEDLAGRPFVGPAGAVFDEAARAAGLDRGAAYITNAVKGFKYAPRGKRRIHQRPDAGEVTRCRWWLDLERDLVRPRLILAMGSTALASLTGSGQGILSRRGRAETLADGTPVLPAVHPAYLLRLPDRAQAAAERARFEADVARAVALARAAA
ncbi:Uracil DNA glycosylase superfamily protein [Roseivivax jejudonensis]|uniref:Type-4 uracil-DNA glycosylase n=1 Tax=Roseivivax jejudonensis TaxID=1529041 RepID=A0A1X7A3P7_9RHOB|nr:UdgX family uracil-DNA binding protein [Roseivivax jejudonensis]SLN69748.1 Uracil DNA glycosylase superfamily protein [Roseivivax jejudonensis]